MCLTAVAVLKTDVLPVLNSQDGVAALQEFLKWVRLNNILKMGVLSVLIGVLYQFLNRFNISCKTGVVSALKLVSAMGLFRGPTLK